MKISVGNKLFIQLERVPIYGGNSYIGTGKVTEKTVEVTEKEGKTLFVKGIGWKRNVGGVNIPVHGKLYLRFKDGGILNTNTCKYECQIVEVL